MRGERKLDVSAMGVKVLGGISIEVNLFGFTVLLDEPFRKRFSFAF